jgi:UDP-glucose 4-epimerase
MDKIKVLITGAAGFVASNLANKLIKHPEFEVYGVDNLKFGHQGNLHPSFNQQIPEFGDRPRFQVCDFRDLHVSFLAQFDVLVHMACANILYAEGNEIDTLRVNAQDSIDLINRFPGKVVYTSTCSVYGNQDRFPINESAKTMCSNAYDHSKLILEKYLALRGNFTTLRLSNVYGPNQHPGNKYAGVVARFIDRIFMGKPIQLRGEGFATRDYTYVGDTVRAIMAAITQPARNIPINIASGVEYTAFELASMIMDVIDKHVSYEVTPALKIDSIQRRVMDIELASQVMNWTPKVSLREGIERTVEWYKETFL